ncbi:MAG: polysaccharide biosynthesis/export family protein [Planctomycetota bacterium]
MRTPTSENAARARPAGSKTMIGHGYQTPGTTTVKTRTTLRLAPPILLAGVLLGSTGCSVDSYLDPSVTGRWEETPIEVPILRRLSAIEPDTDQFVETSEVTPADLRPEVSEYRLSPGDTITVIIFDYPSTGSQTPFPVRVEDNGTIDLAGIGKFFILGLTGDQVQRTIVEGLAAQDLIRNATVAVTIDGRRSNLFNIIGSVRQPGPYFIPEPSYRLLDALAAAGGLLDESTAEVFVIRQTALSEEFGDPGRVGSSGRENSAGLPEDIEDRAGRLIDLIDQMSREGEDGEDGSPGVFGAVGSLSQPEADDQPEDTREPVIDLVQPGGNRFDTSPSQWIFLDGRWVQIEESGVGVPDLGLPELAEATAEAEALVTQRVISVPVEPLLRGDARQNLIVRPGDLIRVPAAGSGTIYIGGQIARAGAYNFSPQLTLYRLITSAGGLGGLAIPERVDLTRMVGTDRQATVRLNLREIAEGTHPDIFLKPNDHIVIGTNFWAFPLAVVRGGFRASYGFGFLLDRNFGNDVFGAPPTNRDF